MLYDIYMMYIDNDDAVDYNEMICREPVFDEVKKVWATAHMT